VTAIVAGVEGDGSPGARLARTVQLTVPPPALFLVAGTGDDGLADLEAPGALPFPRAAPADAPADVLLAEVEAARGEGVDFMVLPRQSLDWLPAGFAGALRAAHRVVLDGEDCLVVALHDTPAASGPGPDGLPLPPPEFIGLTLGIYDVPLLYGGFIESGARDAHAIRDILRTNGPGVRRLGALLDFGCGCGRVLRHWANLPDTRVHGSDFNPHMIEWCRRELSFAAFSLNGVAPPLEYDDEAFDLVYAVSVFTHLPEPLQLPWLRELARVVRPGGRLLLSLNGTQQAAALLEGSDRERFEAGDLAVIWAERAGTNASTVFHPVRYRREEFAPAAGLEVLAERPDAICNAGQDLLLLRRP
jgi:SAM-dependent methyltransferase